MNYKLIIEHCAFTCIIFLNESNNHPDFLKDLNLIAENIKSFSESVKDYAEDVNNPAKKMNLAYKIDILTELYAELPSSVKNSILNEHATHKEIWENLYGLHTYFYFFEILPTLKRSLSL